jgi:RNA polymerase sigma-54 factor
VSAKQDHFKPTRFKDNRASFEDFSPAYEDLGTFILRQIAPDLEPEERNIAAHILTQLDERGFLTTTVFELSRFLHVMPSEIEGVLTQIQQCDPIGCGTQNAQEAMLVQARILAEQGEIPAHTIEALDDGIDLLSKKQYAELGELLGIRENEAKRIAEFITANLNPIPTRAFYGNVRHRSEENREGLLNPDVVINLQGDHSEPQMIVEVLWPLRGRLKVNEAFLQAMKDAPEGKKEQWQQAIDKAQLLVKCMGQRNHTMVRLMEQLCNLQREYILHGAKHMKPITRAAIAEELEVHESTISRAVAGKAVKLPSGKVVEIADFFDRSLHIRTTLKELINEEEKPLSDTKLAKKLSEEGYSVARRTVAKYRAMEGILPAHMRK